MEDKDVHILQPLPLMMSTLLVFIDWYDAMNYFISIMAAISLVR